MKKTKFSFLAGITFILIPFANCQTVIWTEPFSNACASDCMANGYVGPNGPWTTFNTGVNAADPSVWYVSGAECGNLAGACGVGCGATDPSLHIGSNASVLGDLGAAYLNGGLGFWFVDTDVRAESPTIDLSTYSNITINFNYLESLAGDPGADLFDNATLYYFDGVVWTQIDVLAPTAAGCSPQGTWTAFSAVLPASADFNPNVKIGFRWTNNDDGIGVDPTFAVDDITLTIPSVSAPVASFTTPTTTICVGSCIDFTNTSTGGPFTATDWTFTGATPAISGVNNPTNICYNTAGTYQVALSVTDANGTDVQTTPGYITVVDAPNAGANGTSNICNNVTLDLNTILSGADAGGTWLETSGTPSGQFTAGTGVLDGNGLPVGTSYTFSYTVNATAPCVGSDVSTFTVTVINCAPGAITASFTPASTNICVGDCIVFVENSIGVGITSWTWAFANGTPATFVGQHPAAICFNTAGTQNVTLTISDGSTTDDTTIAITVNALPNVSAIAAPSNVICAGDPVTLTGSGATSYSWSGGVSDGVSFIPATSGSYTVTGTDANSCVNTASITITVTVCVPMVAGFSYNDNICVDDCITLTDTTTGNPISWNWDFGGGATPNTSTDRNPIVCFNTAGTYNIQLTTTDATANTSSTTNSITVFDLPSVIAQYDTIIDIGQEVELMANATAGGSFWWTPASADIACDTCSSTTAAPIVDTYFYVTFTDVNGCIATDSLMVLVNFIEAIDVPQAFSPNEDNNNDILFVKGFGITLMDFKVYNRYGQLVFHTTDQSIGWDGKFHSKDENPGVFVWVLQYTTLENQSNVISGNTTLIR